MSTPTAYLGSPRPNVNDPADSDTWGDDVNACIDANEAAVCAAQFPLNIASPDTAAHKFLNNTRFPIRIRGATLDSELGACTFTILINGVAIEGAPVSVTTTQGTLHSYSAIAAIGDSVSYQFSELAGAAYISGNIWYDQIGVGTP